jgi:hypothetical protein
MKINTSQPKQKASQPRETSEQPKAREEQHYDRSDDLVELVRTPKATARREMEAFGDPSEYEITIIKAQKKKDPADSTSNADLDEPQQ